MRVEVEGNYYQKYQTDVTGWNGISVILLYISYAANVPEMHKLLFSVPLQK